MHAHQGCFVVETEPTFGSLHRNKKAKLFIKAQRANRFAGLLGDFSYLEETFRCRFLARIGRTGVSLGGEVGRLGSAACAHVEKITELFRARKSQSKEI